MDQVFFTPTVELTFLQNFPTYHLNTLYGFFILCIFIYYFILTANLTLLRS